MRSHAKAPTAGSTQRRIRRLGTSAAALCTVVTGLALLAAPASAKSHPFKEILGSSAKPIFSFAPGIAVDQSSGDVLVLDAPRRTIRRFNSDGTPDNFSALGANEIDGNGTGIGDDKTPQNELFFGGPGEAQIAIDNSGTATDGNIYVTQSSPNLINVFSETGEYLGQLTESTAGPFTEACGVAVDSSGIVYVGDFQGGIHKFVPSGNPPVNSDNTTTFTSTNNPCLLASGAGPTAGSLFAATYFGQVAKIDSSTGALQYVVSEGVNLNPSVDPVSGNLYTSKGNEVHEFDASGPFSALESSKPIVLSQTSTGIAVEDDDSNVYIVHGEATNIEVYGPATSAPIISEDATNSATFDEAKVTARIHPNGLPTSYHIEYGLDSSYGLSTSEKTIGSADSPLPVSTTLLGLTPGTTYHWQLVATNSSATSDGPDHIFHTYPRTPPDTSCSNQTFRTGPAATLPDCRAYEMVSPVDKNGGDIFTRCNIGCQRTATNQSSTDGNKFTYSSYAAFAGAPANRFSNQYMATREADGWSSRSISLPRSKSITFPRISFAYDTERQYRAFTDDLSSTWVTDNNNTPLDPNGLAGNVNLIRRDNVANSFEAVTQGSLPPGELGLQHYTSDELLFGGYSDDLSHQVFIAMAGLTPDALPGHDRQIYDLSGGQLHLVSVLPDGTPASNAMVGHVSYSEREGFDRNAVSNDGSHIFWINGFFRGPLFARVNNSVTIPISESVSNRKAYFIGADPTGSKVAFTLVSEVENGDTTDLYRFDMASETPTLVAHKARQVVGVSEDTSRIYFVSSEVLAAGAIAGEDNLYLDDGGVKTFIAHTAAAGARVTPDGNSLAFGSTESLTGYDNKDAANGKRDREIFVYHADSGDLTCVSCNPTGSRPAGRAMQVSFSADEDAPTNQWAAAWIPATENDHHVSHVLSDDGDIVFFNSFDALVPQDTNGVQDVYEWEAEGSGSCQKVGGCISLISTGESPKRSEFVDATADGSDVFFETFSSIDPRDPGLIDIYDARVGGGYPIPTASPPCIGDACQSIPAAPNDQTPSSASFRGEGNPRPSKAQRRCNRRHRKAARPKGGSRAKKAKRCSRSKRGVAR